MKKWSDKRCAWLALYSVRGLGNTAARRLIDKFGDPESVFEAGMSELLNVKDLSREACTRITKREFAFDPEEELEKVEKCGARLITYGDEGYPSALRQIHDPPIILYVKGKAIDRDEVLVSVVGSRNATYYGIRATEQIAEGLARRGAGVVSGMARGIDSTAHRGCLRGGGYTVAVMGTGVDVVYPASNKKLFGEIAEKGSVLSEFPMGTPPEPRNFPIRNRIISGLSRGVVVVEASKKSGSLITASLALEQGREVFAVPGSIESFKSVGTHYLIKQGAALVENAEDILSELSTGRVSSVQESLFQDLPRTMVNMTEQEAEVYEAIGNYPTHIDDIVRRVKKDPGELLSLLMNMELKGVVEQLPGKMFVQGQKVQR